MYYLIRLLLISIFAFITIPLVHATEPAVKAPVPHNNGTHSLLKNTYIEPIENFNSLSRKPALQKKIKTTTETTSNTTNDAALTEKKQ